jgi:hypothetical protein
MTWVKEGRLADSAGTVESTADTRERHSSDSQLDCDEVELTLDTCEAASEKTEEVEEDAEEESWVLYGCVSGTMPKAEGRISRLMLVERND